MSRIRNKAPVLSKDLFTPFAKDGLAAQLVDSTPEQRPLGQVRNQQWLGDKMLLRAIRSSAVLISSSGWHTFEDNFLPAKLENQKQMPLSFHGTLKISTKTRSFGALSSRRQLWLQLVLLSGCRHNACSKRRVLRQL